MISTWSGMGTQIEVHTSNGWLRDLCRQRFWDAEQRFSRFIAESELSMINRSSQESVTVSHEMSRILAAAMELRDRTDGLVDPGVGGSVVDWGYDRTYSSDFALDSPPEHRPIGSWTIDDMAVTVGADTQLDLGGIAKGWTCDRVVESGCATVASAGGDLRSVDPSLVVTVDDAGGRGVAEIPVGVGALATSSTTRRRWTVGGAPAHHIIDPRTMAPATTPAVSASVTAATAAEAEAGAKAVLLLGVDGLAWAARQPWIRTAIVIWWDGTVYSTSPQQDTLAPSSQTEFAS